MIRDATEAVRNAYTWFEQNGGWAPPDAETLAEWVADGVYDWILVQETHEVMPPNFLKWIHYHYHPEFAFHGPHEHAMIMVYSRPKTASPW